MIYLAIAILISSVLFLIDRNHAWARTWKIAKWTAIVIVTVAVLGGGGLYEYDKWSGAREMKRRQEFEQAQAAAKEKAIADRWSEINSLEKEVCGDKRIVVFNDPLHTLPETGEIACGGDQSVAYSDSLPISSAACAVVQNKLPTFTCRIAPVFRIVPPQQVRHLRMTSVIDQDLTTEEVGTLKCGTVKPGEIVTLLIDNGLWVKVRTKSGQVGWAEASNFEVVR